VCKYGCSSLGQFLPSSRHSCLIFLLNFYMSLFLTMKATILDTHGRSLIHSIINVMKPVQLRSFFKLTSCFSNLQVFFQTYKLFFKLSSFFSNLQVFFQTYKLFFQTYKLFFQTYKLFKISIGQMFFEGKDYAVRDDGQLE